MSDDSHVIDKGWDALPAYADKGDADDAVTVSLSTTPGEWLVNTSDSVVVPMSMADLVDGLRSGRLSERSLVWRQGMQEWSALGAVPQLKLAGRLPQRSPASETPQPARPTAPPLASRRSTLPFGMPAPSASRPSQPRPAPSPAESADEPEVLAVYTRPAATISFDLPPEPGPRTPVPAATVPPPASSAPHTLAPTTSDNVPLAPSAHRFTDRSVVAAADYRAVQRTGQRRVLAWSLASAAAASLLTFWLAKAPQTTAPAAATPTPASTQTPAPVEPAAPPPTSASAVVSAIPAESAASAVAVQKPIPAAAPRKATRAPVRRPKPATTTTEPLAAPDAPSPTPANEPNPYDVKLEDDAPAPAAAAESKADDSGLAEAIRAATTGSSDSQKPGF